MTETLQVVAVELDDAPAMVDTLRTASIAIYALPEVGFTPAEVLDHLDDDWTAQKVRLFEERIQDPYCTVVAAKLGNTVIGYRMAQPDRQNGSLYVRPEYQGGVVGLRLLAAVVTQVSLDTSFTLTVIPRTPAERLYKHLGFMPTGRDLSAELPRLKSGTPIPQVELSIAPERASRTIQHVQRLLHRNR